LDPVHAVLVVEIARHRAQLADCGSAYGESRRLRDCLDSDRRRRILDSLEAVAEADGHTCSIERAEIRQIAHELGFTSLELGP
jgi:uncharacterized tellurite resistance protein B-like protein